MLPQCIAQRFIYRGKGVKRFIIVQNFVVDAALKRGAFKLPGLGGILHAVEKWALRGADQLSTISPEMLTKLRQKIGHGRPIQYVPNWVHRDLAAEIERQQATPESREPRTLFYSGNMGIKQGLSDFIEDFAGLDSDWILRVHGGGAEAGRIRERISSASVDLGPVEGLPTQVRRLRRCTACLITQGADSSANALPGNLLPALATRTPILAVAEDGSPLAREIAQGGYGVVVKPGDKLALKEALRILDDPATIRRMSELAAQRAIFFSRDRVLGQHAATLRQMTEVVETFEIPQLSAT
jgi:colanic acid biosynthesis glycosyl transferase WcaI